MNNQPKDSQQEETKIYLTSNSTLQTPAEHQHDQSVDPRKDNNISVSRDDINETDRYRDRADGTSDSGQDS